VGDVAAKRGSRLQRDGAAGDSPARAGWDHRRPDTVCAMASGRLSYSKTLEITRVASAETEDYLLMIAEHGTDQHGWPRSRLWTARYLSMRRPM
jgi:hypothetical protein